MNGSKPWYTSKTIWFAIVAVATLVANQFGFTDFKLDPEVTGGVVALVSLVLRLITRQPIHIR